MWHPTLGHKQKICWGQEDKEGQGECECQITYNIQAAQTDGTPAEKGPWECISGPRDEATNPEGGSSSAGARLWAGLFSYRRSAVH